MKMSFVALAEKANVKICLLLGGVFATSVAIAAVTWVGEGESGSWSDPGNWYGGNLPSAGEERIYIYAGEDVKHPMTVDDDNVAFASTIQMYYGYSKEYDDGSITNSVLRYMVTTNAVMASQFAADLEVVVDTDAELKLTSGGADVASCWFTLQRGTVVLPSPGTGGTRNFGYFKIGPAATLVLMGSEDGAQYTQMFANLKCHGVISNAHPSVSQIVGARSRGYYGKPHFSSNDDPATVFSDGRFEGLISVYSYGVLHLENVDNRFFNNEVSVESVVSSTEQAVLGVSKIGTTADPVSSVGSLNVFKGVPNANNVLFRYLGDGETTDKTMEWNLYPNYVSYANLAMPGFDGGENGNVIFTGKWSSGTDSYNQQLLLDGENVNGPCVLQNAIENYSFVSEVNNPTTHVVKRGKGVWRFAEPLDPLTGGGTIVSRSKWHGGYTIEEGTVQFDTYGERGAPISLGTSSQLYENYAGEPDENRRVDWAFSLGTSDADGSPLTEGALEYLGDETVYSSQRKIALAGNGRLIASGAGRLGFSGVSALTAGDKVFVLESADPTVTNSVAEISNGAGRVSVVKEGRGTWMLHGNQTFSGDLLVKDGVLLVNADTNAYTWYRFTVRETAGSTAAILRQLALYSADGIRQNMLMELADGLQPYRESSGTWNTPFTSDLKPGEFALGKCGLYTWSPYSSGGGLEWWFQQDIHENAGKLQYFSYYNPSRKNNAFTWQPIVMRLAEGVPAITSYDLCAIEWVKKWDYLKGSAPTSFMLEGSTDGMDWQVLHDMPTFEVTDDQANAWYSNGATFDPENTVRQGYSVPSRPTVSMLTDVGAVGVAVGATLRNIGEPIVPIKALKVGLAGGGTIDGFEFAEEGTVDFCGELEKGVDYVMPISIVNSATRGNLLGWGFTVNGKPCENRVMTVTKDGFKLSRKGLVLILR